MLNIGLWWIVLAGSVFHQGHAVFQDIFVAISTDDQTCDLTQLDADTKCDTYINKTTVSDNIQCWISNANDNVTMLYRCSGGIWLNTRGQTETESSVHREKKAIFTGLAALVTIVGFLFEMCDRFCPKADYQNRQPNNPPSFTRCKPPDTFTIQEEGATSMRVDYDTPLARDHEDGDLTPSLVKGLATGSIVSGAAHCGRTYSVIYKATDSKGESDICYFDITVKVIGCTEPVKPLNGYVKCTTPDKGLIYGNKCTYACNNGYSVVNTARVISKCQKNGKMSLTGNGVPICEKITCTKPDSPQHGTFDCSDGYNYLTTCTVTCDTGYATKTTTQITCQDSGQWSDKDYINACKDSEAPAVDCISVTPQTFYTERGYGSAVVNWKPPPATDNVDQSNSIPKYRSDTGGLQQGDRVTEGDYYVKYKAKDLEGNESPECQITIKVKEITCKHPVDEIGDSVMEFNCSSPTYRYGSECLLSCQWNFPINGSDVIVCEKNDSTSTPESFWSYTGDHAPECTVTTCPTLTPPLNGALAIETQNLRPMAVMLCNDQYDIPVEDSNFTGYFFCLASGKWTPSNKTRDCTEKRHATFFVLSAELLYKGNCSDESTQADIRQIFLDKVVSLKPSLDAICPNGLNCTMKEITVDCGLQARRKRSADVDIPRLKRNASYFHRREAVEDDVFIRFDLALGINTKGVPNWISVTVNTFQPAVEAMKNVIQEKYDQGELKIEGLILGTDAFQTAQYADFSCPAGQVKHRQLCKACPIGFVLDDITNTCVECPKGTYMDRDAGTVCTSCPVGTSTRATGSKSSEDCIPLCSPGSVSYDEVEPCSLCPEKQYQSGTGQSQCLHCPSGKTTQLTGSDGEEDCQDYDVLLAGSVTLPLLVSDSDNVAINLWIRKHINVSHGVTLKLTTSGQPDNDVTLYVTDALEVRISGTSYTATDTNLVDSSQWAMLTLVVDGTTGSLTLYQDGDNVLQKPFTPLQSAILQSGSEVVIDTSKETYISGFSLSPDVPTSTEVTSLMTQCSSPLPAASANMDVFLQSVSVDLSLVVPTSCDPINECKSKPCGEHKCLNGIGTYTCDCSNGFSGRNCTIPPDYCASHECQHGATCVQGTGTYTCSCPLGYSGGHCQVLPVDGGWGAWTQWSGCDVTCGRGSRTRNRLCNNPVKDAYGIDCEGESTEIQPCNTEECRICPDIDSRSFGASITCDGSLETVMTCTFKCRLGKILASGLRMQTYKCGHQTVYKWQPNFNPPSCSDLEIPDYLQLETHVRVWPPIDCDSVGLMTSEYEQALSVTSCLDAGTCTPNVAIDGCDNSSRRKHSTNGSDVFINLTASLQLTGGFDLDKLLTNNIVSQNLQDFIGIFNTMETTAQQLTNDSSTLLSVTLGDVTYSIETSSTTTAVGCSDGFVGTEGVCVPCPVGSWSNSRVCIRCDLGTYQDQTGMVTCASCPVGYTTPSIGSVEASDCSVPTSMTSGGLTTSSTIPPSSSNVTPQSSEIPTSMTSDGLTTSSIIPPSSSSVPPQSSDTYIIIGCVIGGCLIAAVIVAIIVRRIKRDPVKTLSGSSIHANVRPETPVNNAFPTPVLVVQKEKTDFSRKGLGANYCFEDLY